ncbi:YitT family protein [Desulfosporosinus sp.]|uniref:YitT family protein n=1 Tax=Desulfosporosinus sp. TaxID=157907 RepID=UPI002322F9DD|nr:YitT family protein [Desulfosporosinus sp.]MCO5386469.1 YitT family protein [Desulfosporosinus sp.]MDA8222228.1 YitT family protein [Desulfitobacterium hafniense]
MKLTKRSKSIGGIIGIAVGAILAAYGIQGFIVYSGLSGGGVGGIALLLYYSFNLPIGIVTFILNVPLFVLGWKEVDKQFVFKTIWGLAIFSIFLDLFNGVQPFDFNDIFLGALYGGVISGVSSAIVFRFGGSLGGTDIVSKVIQRKYGVPMGTSALAINGVIILISWAVLGPKAALYTLVMLFVYGRVLDLIESGVPAKSITIISDRSEELVARIMVDLGRGATFLHGRGAYSCEPKDIVICVVSLPEIGRLKRAVREIDPQAFIIIQNAGEVFGSGFISNE